MIPQNKDCLDIAVIGAGIAGLAAALCLCRAGHQVTLYERSEFKNEVGAAINMPPQAIRLLRQWGVARPDSTTTAHQYADEACGTPLRGTRRLDAETLQVLLSSSYDTDEETYGASFSTYHRADLHSALRVRAESAGAKVVLGKMAVKLNCEAGEFVVVDSHSRTGKEVVKKDLIVLADGVHSMFGAHVTGTQIPLHETGRSAFRSLIPMDKLLSDPEASKLFQQGGHLDLTGCTHPKTGVFLVTYPCRSGGVMNIAIFTRMQPESRRLSDWDSPATIEQALNGLEGFHPSFKAMIRCADDMRVYTVLHRDPLPNYVKGRVVLIGDAAHPMLPTLAAGGSTSLEDAAALEVLLHGLKPDEPAKLADRLRLWEALRLPRDVTTQVLSKTMVQPKPATAFASEVRHVYSGYLPDVALAGNIKPTRDFMSYYDAYEESKKALEWAERDGGYAEENLMAVMQERGVIRHFGGPSSDSPTTASA